MAADLAKTDMFTKRLEQAVTKGRYATIGTEGLPVKTVIGKGSKERLLPIGKRAKKYIKNIMSFF